MEAGQLPLIIAVSCRFLPGSQFFSIPPDLWLLSTLFLLLVIKLCTTGRLTDAQKTGGEKEILKFQMSWREDCPFLTESFKKKGAMHFI